MASQTPWLAMKTLRASQIGSTTELKPSAPVRGGAGVAGLLPSRPVSQVAGHDAGQSVGHSDNTDRDTAADTFAAGHDVRFEIEVPGAATEYGELSMGLVNDQQGSGGAHLCVERRDELRRRQHQAAVGQGRSSNTAATSPLASRARNAAASL